MEELEVLFTEMFVDFDEHDKDYDFLFENWLKMGDEDIENSFTYYKNYLQYCSGRNKKPNLFFYFKDKKWNWMSVRKNTKLK